MVLPYFISSRSHPKLMFCENLQQDFHLRRLMTLLSNINEHVTFHGPEWKLISCDAGLSACFMLNEIIRICFQLFFNCHHFSRNGVEERTLWDFLISDLGFSFQYVLVFTTLGHVVHRSRIRRESSRVLGKWRYELWHSLTRSFSLCTPSKKLA